MVKSHAIRLEVLPATLKELQLSPTPEALTVVRSQLSDTLSFLNVCLQMEAADNCNTIFQRIEADWGQVAFPVVVVEQYIVPLLDGFNRSVRSGSTKIDIASFSALWDFGARCICLELLTSAAASVGPKIIDTLLAAVGNTSTYELFVQM